MSNFFRTKLHDYFNQILKPENSIDKANLGISAGAHVSFGLVGQRTVWARTVVCLAVSIEAQAAIWQTERENCLI